MDNSTSTFDTVFISHKSEDAKYGKLLVKVLKEIGIKDSQIIFTSDDVHNIPGGKSIFNYLKTKISENTFMIYLLSDDYFESPACCNEMGAAWVSSSEYIAFALPNFSRDNKKYNNCAIDTKKIIMSIGKSSDLIDFKNTIINKFNLKDVNEKSWEELKSNILNKYNTIEETLKKKENVKCTETENEINVDIRKDKSFKEVLTETLEKICSIPDPDCRSGNCKVKSFELNKKLDIELIFMFFCNLHYFIDKNSLTDKVKLSTIFDECLIDSKVIKDSIYLSVNDFIKLFGLYQDFDKSNAGKNDPFYIAVMERFNKNVVAELNNSNINSKKEREIKIKELSQQLAILENSIKE